MLKICSYGFFFLIMAIISIGTFSTDISGPISGTLTSVGNPYIVTGDLTVPAGDSLTIEEGVEMRFNAGLKLTANGELHVYGTGESPVTFTSNEATPAENDWEGIDVRMVNAEFHNAVFNYAREAIYDQYGSSTVAVIDCVFNYDMIGVDYYSEYNPSYSITIAGCTFYQCGWGVRLWGLDPNSSVTDCTFDGCGVPIYIGNSYPTFDGLTIYPNQTELYGIMLDASFEHDGTLHDAGYPYFGDLSPSSVNLTIDKGVVLKEARIDLYDGSLVLNGTAEDPVIITCWQDDSVGGDTNCDGPSSGAPGHLEIYGGSGNIASNNAVIKYAHFYPPSSAQISQCAFMSSAFLVEEREGTNIIVNDSRFENSYMGVWKLSGTISASASLSGCSFSGNSGNALSLSGNPLNITVSNCDFSGNGTAVYFDATSTANLGSTVSGGGYNQFLCNGINVNSLSSATIMAENNWWGASPPDASKIIGNVDYTPYLTGPLRDVLTDMTVSLSGSSDVSLAWQDLSNGCGYRVLRSALPDSAFADISGIISTTGFTDPGAASIPGVLYYKVELQ